MTRTVAAAEELAAHRRSGTLIPAYVDLLDADSVAALVAEHRPGAIVHLAAILAPVSYRNPRQARKVNVGGTANVVAAAAALPKPPLIVYASSAAVYGSRNPHRHPERITPATAVQPADQYGEDKARAEKVLADSGLPWPSCDWVESSHPTVAMNSDYLLLMRAMPGDNRMHTVDARDVALAFANAVDRGASDRRQGPVDRRATKPTSARNRELEDDMMQAVGLGRLGPKASLPGDPNDDHGWGFTGWFDTTESQALLDFQRHDWKETVAWAAGDQVWLRRILRVLGPGLRPLLRLVFATQRRVEKRGRYADPWTLIGRKYGPDAIAPDDLLSRRI